MIASDVVLLLPNKPLLDDVDVHPPLVRAE